MSDDERAFIARHKPSLVLLDDRALNGEAPAGALDGDLTSFGAFFVRNNGDLPAAAFGPPDRWRLIVDGEVERPAAFGLADLTRLFPSVTITAVLECAGNGRAFYEPQVSGAQWRYGAVGCARWTGIRMADLLAHVGVTDRAVYTAHHSPDRLIDDPDRPALSRGLPLVKALAPETLLAFAMNDQPLHALHGGPLRVVVPGFPGSAWQKWLCRLQIRDREHDGEKMNGTDYRMPVSPVAPGEPIDPAQFAVITDMPVKSVITRPGDGFMHMGPEPLTVSGFAWSGSVPAAGVAVSVDEGASWVPAELAAGEGPFAWRRFRVDVAVAPGPLTVMARATDAAGACQPVARAPWNPRGYLNNAVHRIVGTVMPH
ncbi:sulfite oxidase [Phreatobacter sp.]|uniref:sulfite oxidase n=1 Tax=Phreatobacter sp. TaxID=1966341 RepID=UPI003F712952